VPHRLISKYTKDTLHFIGQPIFFLLKKQSMLLFVAVAVTECAFSSAAWGLPLYLGQLAEEGGQTELLGIQLSIITSVYFIVSLSTASFFGSFSDRFGRRPFLILGTAIAGISFLIFPIMYTFYSENPFSFFILVITNGMKGLAAAMISGPVLAVFADISPDENHGETMGKFYLAKSAGGAIGYPFGLISWTILKEGAFFFFAIVMFLATSIYLFRFFEPRRDLAIDESETLLSDFSQIVKDSDIDMNPFKTMIESLQDKQFRKFAIAWLAYTTLIGASAFVAPLVIIELVDAVGILIAIIGFIAICIMGILQPVLGKLSDNVGRKPFLVIGVVGTSMLLVTLASILDYKSTNGDQEWELSEVSDLLRNPFSFTETISLRFIPDYPFQIPHIILVLMIAIFGLSASGFASAALGLISDVAKSEHRGREMGFTQSLMAMGNIIGASIGGYFVGLGPAGIIGLFLFCFGLSLIAIVIIVLFLYETSGFYHFTHKLV